MATKRENVTVGLFATSGTAKQAIHDLREAGFSDRDIGVVTKNREGEPEVTSFRELEGNRAKAGAVAGAAAGVGGGALWALGIAAGILPAIGPVIAGGLLAAVAASAAAAGGAGAVVGALVGLGITNEEAAYYDEEFRKGRTILVVRGYSRRNLVQTILRGNGAEEPRALTEHSLADQVVNRSPS